MQIEPEYEGLDHATDATALLRPKTSLKDMFLEVDPGRGQAARARARPLPSAQTIADVIPDEILAHARRRHARLPAACWSTGAGRGLEGPRRRPARDLPAVRAHAPRPRARELGGGRPPRQPAPARALAGPAQRRAGRQARTSWRGWCMSASRVFRAYASEDQNISAAVRELPSALRQTTDTLGEVERLAEVLGPASEHLRPAARALGPQPGGAAAAGARGRAAAARARSGRSCATRGRWCASCGPASRDLAAATPDLTRVFEVLNRLLQHGRVQPARPRGPGRRTAARRASCSGSPGSAHQSANRLLDRGRPRAVPAVARRDAAARPPRPLAHDQPELEFLMNLTPLLTNPAVCGE